jgi:hypothetical protein
MKEKSPWDPQAAAYPLAACLLVAVFLSFIFNRFLPAQDAWFAHYGELMRAGRLPYRDFYCFIQPLPLLIARGIVAVGGDYLIWFRLYGVAERLALTLVLYDMLRQCFSRYAAFVGTVVAVVMMTSSADDAFFSYLVTCILFSAAAMSALARGFRTQRAACFRWCGVFLALAFFSKQSSGGLLGVALFGALLWCGGSFRATWQRLVQVGAGFAIVGLAFAAILFAWGVTGFYVREVFFNAVGQKGGASTILTGFLPRLNQTPFVVAVVTGAALLLTGGLAGWLRPWPASAHRRVLFFGTVAIFLLGFMLPVAASAVLIPWYSAHRIYISLRFVVPLTFYATLVLLIWLVSHRRKLQRERASCNPGLLGLAAGSMAGLIASGMSFEISAAALAPSLGLCLAYAFDFLAGLPAVRIVLVALSVFLVGNGATEKDLCSYWWWGWQDTSLHPPGHADLPQLAGFNLNPAEVTTYEDVVRLITDHTAPGDTVFSFPNIPLFNVLTGHLQPTFAPVHYLDVCPDAVQLRDAAFLRENPPRIIVWLRATPAQDAWVEQSFRGHAPNGYQEITATLQALTASPAYTRIYRSLYNDESFPLEVWMRR